MKLYLIEKPGDTRDWPHPTFNLVYPALVDGIEERTIELVEDENGEIYIEQYTNQKSMRVTHFRVSGLGQKSIHSDWIKRFTAVQK
jgi:hypothetical protein